MKINSAIVTSVMLLGGLAASSTALARGDAGCGLGGLIITGKSKSMQLLAVTSNASFGSQTFGISSGTSGCKAKGIVQKQTEQLNYAEANFETLRNEIAQGQGDTLVAFSSLLGCQNSAHLGTTLQAHFGSLFPQEGSSPAVFLAETKDAVRASAVLSNQCSQI